MGYSYQFLLAGCWLLATAVACTHARTEIEATVRFVAYVPCRAESGERVVGWATACRRRATVVHQMYSVDGVRSILVAEERRPLKCQTSRQDLQLRLAGEKMDGGLRCYGAA